MRLLIAAFIVICIAGCGTDASPKSSVPATPTYQPPTSYAAAVLAAQSPAPLGVPVGPWDCAPVQIVGTPGVVLIRHSGSVSESYTADAQGNFRSANGFSLNMLVPPRTTLWVTVASPLNAEIHWSGAQFVAADNTGATWTAPEVVNTSTNTTIRCEVAPSGDG